MCPAVYVGCCFRLHLLKRWPRCIGFDTFSKMSWSDAARAEYWNCRCFQCIPWFLFRFLRPVFLSNEEAVDSEIACDLNLFHFQGWVICIYCDKWQFSHTQMCRMVKLPSPFHLFLSILSKHMPELWIYILMAPDLRPCVDVSHLHLESYRDRLSYRRLLNWSRFKRDKKLLSAVLTPNSSPFMVVNSVLSSMQSPVQILLPTIIMCLDDVEFVRDNWPALV